MEVGLAIVGVWFLLIAGFCWFAHRWTQFVHARERQHHARSDRQTERDWQWPPRPSTQRKGSA